MWRPGHCGRYDRRHATCEWHDANPSNALSGADTIKYEILLTPQQAVDARSVGATLYDQSIPPSFLFDRFEHAFKGAAKKDDIGRL